MHRVTTLVTASAHPASLAWIRRGLDLYAVQQTETRPVLQHLAGFRSA